MKIYQQKKFNQIGKDEEKKIKSHFIKEKMFSQVKKNESALEKMKIHKRNEKIRVHQRKMQIHPSKMNLCQTERNKKCI